MRISEIYLSVQGEGPRVGMPTVFVRFAGCNLKCAGWACDSQFAIDPGKYRHEWKTMTPKEIYDEIQVVIEGHTSINICFTGGEPFLQNHDEFEILFDMLDGNPAVGTLETFSNGTILYPKWAIESLSFVMDWKLKGSGEILTEFVKEMRHENFLHLDSGFDVVKFTIKDRDDYDLAKLVYSLLGSVRGRLCFYYGVVWNSISNEELVGWVLEDKLPWIHTMQVHNYIWNREKRGI